MASLLPYILNEFRDLTREEPLPRRQRHWLNDVDDVLADYTRPTPALWLHLPGTLTGRPRHTKRTGSLKQLEKKLSKNRGALTEYDSNGPLSINVDVQDYRPEELSVKVLKDEGCVVVEGRHEESGEHSFVQHHFTRRYKLPSDVDPDTVTSRLSADGVLQVSAPKKDALPAAKDNVRQVSIVCSNQPAAVTSVEKEVDVEFEKAKDSEKRNQQ